MLKKLSPLYTAKNFTKNIKKICRGCETYTKNKMRGQNKYGLMSHLHPATKPFEIVSIDTIGGLGGSRSTKRYLHLLVDHFTRYAFIITSKTQNTKDFVKLTNNIAETEDIDMLLTDQYPGINFVILYGNTIKYNVSQRETQLRDRKVNNRFDSRYITSK